MQKLSTDLADRVLRFDGVSIVDPSQLASFLLRGASPSTLRVSQTTSDVELFNANVAEGDVIAVGDSGPVRLDFAWLLPPDFLTLDVTVEIAKALEAKNLPPAKLDAAMDRIAAELEQFEARGMMQFLRSVIYVLHVFRQQGVVWGVGRGSSCASYVLYLLGLHSVDCLRFNVPMEEFFHE